MTELERIEQSVPAVPLEERTRIILEHKQGAEKAAVAYQEHCYRIGEQICAAYHNGEYRDKYSSFEECARNEWDFSRKQATRLMRFYEVVTDAREKGLPEPQNPNQVDGLQGHLSRLERIEIWENAVYALESIEDASRREIVKVTGEPHAYNALTADELRAEINELRRKLEARHELHFEEILREEEDVEIILPDGRSVDVQQIYHAIEEFHRAQELEEALSEREEGLKLLDEKLEADRKAYAEELARLREKYGDDSPLDFLNVPDEEWAEAVRNAKSTRVMEISKILQEFYTRMPERMSEYLPGEGAEAVGDMHHAQDVLDGLEFVHRWIGQVIEEMDKRWSMRPTERDTK